MAGGIVQRGSIHFHQHAGGHPEGLHFGSVQNAFFNFTLQSNQQDEIFSAQIELAVPVIFQAVELRVVAVAIAQLERHAAKEGFADRFGVFSCVQHVHLGDVFHVLGLVAGFQSGQNAVHGIAFHNAAIGLEGRIGDRINVHDTSSSSFFQSKIFIQ